MRYTTNRELIQKARELRKSMTLAEKILWSELKSKKISGYKFRRQFPVFDYIVDFYCYELNLVIEIDGPVHNLPEIKIYDEKRDNLFRTNGYVVLHLSNDEIISNLSTTLIKIIEFINGILSPSRGTTGGQ